MLYDPKHDAGVRITWRHGVDTIGRKLLNAAEYIEQHGWCQGSLRNPRGSACLIGALYYSNDFRGDLRKDPQWTTAIRRLTKMTHVHPERWNDSSGRTQDEVVHVLRESAYIKG